ncbi:hypothetical protein RISK_005172 [Rhodopirellula islandica]|uniref:Uncharacterized protein n=1 Tax=Rhodopirellula islandica TaxID=595434 RepID=A0A0J1B8T6_RHOIS|nr:hypothetical protein [Rhodopirellula islandica]KLU02876.1 hypothetical protein RISK_005172 [Rhodopirellula islandica]
MARETHDREDLLVEGVNLPERARLRHSASGREWVIGWRKGGGPAIYDGPDRVYQFNRDNQLRRVYLEGSKLAAQGGKLCELKRPEPSPTDDRIQKVQLIWQPIDSASQQNILQQWAETRQQLLDALQSARARDLPTGVTTDPGAIVTNSPQNSQTSEYSWESVGIAPEKMLDRTHGWLVSITDNPEMAAQSNV